MASETENLITHPHATSLAYALIVGIKQLKHNKNVYMQSLRPDIRKVARNHILRNNGYKHVAKILVQETRRAVDAGMYVNPGNQESPWPHLVQAAADISKHRIHVITVPPQPKKHVTFRPHSTTGEQAGTLHMTFDGTTFSTIPDVRGVEPAFNPVLASNTIHAPQYDAARLGPSTALTVVRAGSNASSNSTENPFPPLPNNQRKTTSNQRDDNTQRETQRDTRRDTNNRRNPPRRNLSPPQAQEVISVTSEDVMYGLLTSTAMGSILSLLIRSFQ
jgi:hypothetical protein